MTTITSSTIVPQTYQQIEPNTLFEYIEDDGWAMQQKVDGVRTLVQIRPGREGSIDVTYHGRGGGPLRSTQVTQHFARWTRALDGLGFKGPWTLDCEGMATGELIVFDLPEGLNDRISPASRYSDRREALEQLFAVASAWLNPRGIVLLPEARGGEAKARLWQQVLTEGVEGVCVKRLNAPYYSSEVRTPHVLKAKVYRSIDCVVTARNTGGPTSQNADLAVWRNGVLTPVGSTSMIGKPPAAVGDVVEVKFLHFSGGLVQPTVLRLRPDKPAGDCTWDQLARHWRNQAVLGATA